MADRILTFPYELATQYKTFIKTIAGDIIGTWAEGYQLTSVEGNNKYDEAFALGESQDGTEAMRQALPEIDGGNYQAGDLAEFPWSGHGNLAYYRASLSFARKFNAPGSDASWTKLLLVYRADHSNDPSYNLVP